MLQIISVLVFLPSKIPQSARECQRRTAAASQTARSSSGRSAPLRQWAGGLRIRLCHVTPVLLAAGAKRKHPFILYRTQIPGVCPCLTNRRVILSGFADEAANQKTAVQQFAAFAALGFNTTQCASSTSATASRT